MFSTIIGHENVKSFLEKSIANKRVAHAYIFVGPTHVGKMAVARAFAEKILHNGKKMERSIDVHPDIVFIRREIDPKTEKLKSNITIEQIRGLRERLSYSSLLHGYKVAIIEDAETMTIEAGNALLKTLEEPAGNTIIVLITRDLSRILPTIVSRSQLVRFNLVRIDKIVEGLLKLGVTKNDAYKLAKITRGRPGFAIRLAEDKKEFKNLLEDVDGRKTLISRPIYERIIWIEDWVKKLKLKNIGDEFRLWRELYRDELLKSLSIFELATFDDSVADSAEVNEGLVRKNISVLRRIDESESAHRSHVDLRLAIEHFLI